MHVTVCDSVYECMSVCMLQRVDLSSPLPHCLQGVDLR